MKRAVFFVALAMVLISFCAAQSAANDAQRVVGTWVGKDYTYVFNADGTGVRTHASSNYSDDFSFGIFGNIISIMYGSSSPSYPNVYFSPDGKRMIFDNKVYQKK